MGGCFSCKPALPFDCIRLVHLSGYVEEFSEPVTVAEITGKPSTHFVCSSAHLLSSGSHRMAPEARLEAGNIYFLLPYSIFQSDSSPVDLASLATRLTGIAKRSASPGRSAAAGDGLDIIGRRENTNLGACESRKTTSVRLWKPILESIEEKSIDLRSE